MGRAKLNMKFIEKKKTRHTTFKKRKEGLVRKMHEFTTLCDVKACMIIYGPDQENGAADQPETWPQDPDKVNRVIEIYKEKKKEAGIKTFGLEDFFQERQKKVEDELSKLRKKNMEAKYPTPINLINNQSEGQLREFASALSNKAECVKAKIEEMKKRSATNAWLNSQLYPLPNEMYHPMYTVDHQQMMQMQMMNGGDQFGFGGASSSNGANIQFPSMGQNWRAAPLPFYFVPPPPPHLSFSGGWENQDDAAREEFLQYHMDKKNHGGS